MADYDFRQLSPHDFELMCRDLLQAELGLRLESFKTGKDGGIDFRYASQGKQIIVQCKRFVETGFAGLLRELRAEAHKVSSLKPERYVLMTAAPLSNANKTRIVEVVGAQFLDKADIFSQADLNNLLTRHGEIEQSHYKLWLASTRVLERVLHNDIVTQSEFQVEKIHREIKRYVQGNAYPRAQAVLAQDHVVILSGLPGVGKTTLANMLLYEHLERGFEAVIVRDDFSEGKSMFRRGKRQIFYFDDFMGTTFLGDRGSRDQQREYRAILEFMEMVGSSQDKRLILTTREQMLHQAWNRSEQIRNAGVMDRKVVIQMGDYSMQQRAEILYNHLFFSDLPPDYRDQLLEGDFYLKIVKHDKFNPRLIEWLSSYRRLAKGAVKVGDYQAFVSRLLDDPAEIWRHAYEQQISEAGRSLLLTMFSFGGKGHDQLLRESFAALHSYRTQKYGLPRKPDDYSQARAELHSAFVRPTDRNSLEFINPSVQDWLNRIVGTVPDNALDLIMGANRFLQIDHLWNFARSAVGRGTKGVMLHHIAEIAPKIHELAIAERIIRRPGGTSYHAPGYEETLATMIGMADALRGGELIPVVEAVIARLGEESRLHPYDIEGTLMAIRAFDDSEWKELQGFAPFFASCVDELIASADHGCSSQELYTLISHYEPPHGEEHPLSESLWSAYDRFVADRFSDEMHDCHSEQDYVTLTDRLTYFQKRLGLDVDSELAEVERALEGLRRSEEERWDREMDEYKHYSPSRKSDDDGIRAMFGSLRGGR